MCPAIVILRDSPMASTSPTLRTGYQLADNLIAKSGQIFLTGTQALVRLPLMQRRLDAERGLNTAGFISGYRGSPLGAYDQQLWRAGKALDANNIRFLPAVNEELGATGRPRAAAGRARCEADGRRRIRDLVRQGPRASTVPPMR
jgi:indolepyruvate ferredoxin oxidoreductase